jgi:hypothetical protein
MPDLIGELIRARRKTIDQCEKKLKIGNLTDLQRKHVQWRLAEELFALAEIQTQVADDRVAVLKEQQRPS